MRIDVVSFGFKRGVPRVVDVMFDVRFLPNPHWEPDLRPQTGLDDDVLNGADTGDFLAKLDDMLEFLVPRYQAEGKSYLTIGIGCTGGRHRSVALAEEVGRRLRDRRAAEVTIRHRDLREGRDP